MNVGLFVVTVTLASIAGVTPAHASGYFARFQMLKQSFSIAFADYVNLDYLYPLAKPVTVGPGSRPDGEYTMTITARIRRGAPQTDVPYLALKYDYDPMHDEIDVLTTFISPAVPAQYAWRVIVAELLLKHPLTRGFKVHLASGSGTPDAAGCAELLARGQPPENTYQSQPVARALSRFEFRRTKVEIRDASATTATLGPIAVTLTFVRGARSE